MSDLHLETIPFPEAFQPKRPDFDVLVVAGDVWEGDCARGFRFLRKLAGEKPVIMVMGNHEHWNGVLSEDLEMAKIVARGHSVHLLDGDTVAVEGCVFVGSTLWADYTLGLAEPDPAAETGEQIEIEHDGGTHLITVGDTVVLHNAARERLERLVGSSDTSLPLVVVSHHAPLPDCLTPAMKDTWPQAIPPPTCPRFLKPTA